MKRSYEKYAVSAMIGYYNYDYEMFFNHLDDSVIWYGPNEGQIITGKDNLIKAVLSQSQKLKFSIENVESKLIALSSNIYTLVMSFRLHSIHPNGQTKIYLQRVTVNAQKSRDSEGRSFLKCIFIQISNVAPTESKSLFETESYVPKSFGENTAGGNRLVFPGDNHSTVYIKEDSIKYIVGGKGVFCYVHTDNNIYLVRMLLKDILKTLPDSFYRCHASYIVNLNRVLYLSSRKITLLDSEEIPISVKKYAEIKNDINAFLNNK